MTDPENLVNILAGVNNEAQGKSHSTGNVLPIIARPWGFNHWSPQTQDEGSWWSAPQDGTFRGVRCTHQPSVWVGDWGFFVVRPVVSTEADPFAGFATYSEKGAMTPYRFDITSGPLGVRMELAPTMHGAVVRVTFPSSVRPSERKICAWVPQGRGKDHDEIWNLNRGTPSGHCSASGGGIDIVSRRFSGGVPAGADYGFYARLEAGVPIELHVADRCFVEHRKYEPLNMPGQPRTHEENAEACHNRCRGIPDCASFSFWPDGGCHVQDSTAKIEVSDGITAGPRECIARQCCFALGTDTQLTVRIGTSLISPTQACTALDAEVVGRSVESVAEEGRVIWRDLLTRVEVQDAGSISAGTFARLQIFYTCLYRALLFPRRLDEHTQHGVQHWSPYSGTVRQGIGVTDSGFWDTFRTVYQLLAIAYPSELGDIVQGFLNAFEAGGCVPQWPSPGYREGIMVGAFSDVFLADALLKNIKGFDHGLAWKAISDPSAKTQRKGFKEYEAFGFIPDDIKVDGVSSMTLDYAYADAAVAAVADMLGQPSAMFLGRSQRSLRELFDIGTGLMGQRNSKGEFTKKGSFTWGFGFVEGGPWQHSFPPFDLKTLAELHGGQDNLLTQLRRMIAEPATYDVGSYRAVIHEMREFQQLGFGQYAHSNQPVHHIPYLFALLGDQNTTAFFVRLILERAYATTGFSGDEDNGEMGAWFVLSALGLFAAAVGTTENYVLGAVPLFPRVFLKNLNVTIEAPAASEKNPAIARVLWCSQQLGSSLSYGDLRKGGVLQFLSPGASSVSSWNLRGMLHEDVRPAPETSTILNLYRLFRSLERWHIRWVLLCLGCFFLYWVCPWQSGAKFTRVAHDD